MGQGGRNKYERESRNIYTSPIDNNDSGSLPFSEEEDSCDNISLDIRLQNVNTPILVKISKGDILRVEHEEGRRIIVLTSEGEVCGYIAHPKGPKIIACINNGSQFVARVLLVQGNACDVLVRKANS